MAVVMGLVVELQGRTKVDLLAKIVVAPNIDGFIFFIGSLFDLLSQ